MFAQVPLYLSWQLGLRAYQIPSSCHPLQSRPSYTLNLWIVSWCLTSFHLGIEKQRSEAVLDIILVNGNVSYKFKTLTMNAANSLNLQCSPYTGVFVEFV